MRVSFKRHWCCGRSIAFWGSDRRELFHFTSRLPEEEKIDLTKENWRELFILIKMENQGKQTEIPYLILTSDSFTAGTSLSALFSLDSKTCFIKQNENKTQIIVEEGGHLDKVQNIWCILSWNSLISLFCEFWHICTLDILRLINICFNSFDD